MFAEIKNSLGSQWALTSFGAYGPNVGSCMVYVFTRAEAKRVIKSKGKARLRLHYTTMSAIQNTPILNAEADYTAYVIVTRKCIRFGCQEWTGENASILRKWALGTK